jgi:dTDP-4-dehydrorhamnose 3,5-epimerase
MLCSVDGLKDARIFAARSFPDERGSLLQSYTRSGLREQGIRAEFKQAIQSRSRRGVVRGLHFQWDPPQGKLIRCVSGAIFDVLVDIRPGSPTLGDHVAVELSAANSLMLWAPPGLAHGFMALVEDSIVFYECTEEWSPAAEGGILWSDPAIGIAWPALPPIVSAKDSMAPTLAQWLDDPRSSHFRMPAP